MIEAPTSYHPANLPLVSYPAEAVIALAEKAEALGVLIHIDGIPFGAARTPQNKEPAECAN